MTDLGNVKGVVRSKLSLVGEIQKSEGIGVVEIIHTKEEWATFPQLMSIKGAFYIYSNWREEEDPETHEIINIPAVKIGDGTTYVVDLPFMTEPVTQEDIDRWNNHVGVTVDEVNHNMIFFH